MIIIIGAGLSGITLAQSLLRKNVSFRIFDQSPEEKPQGFGLTLREATTAKILKLLDTDELTFRQAVAVDRNWGSYALSGTNICTGERLSTGAFKASHSKDFRTNRERLRRTIRGDVKVEFGHKLVCFEASAGGVNVEFANGVKLRGGFLIAADGVHSFSQ